MGLMKNRGGVGDRAWNLVRASLLWARKGGVWRRRVAMELRLVPKYLKRLGHTTPPTHHIHYFERELSFDKTPIFHRGPTSMRFHLPHIPCLNPPHVDFDYDFNDGDDGINVVEHDYEEEGIDKRAEEFIAKFYQQMKLQRQVSLLQYNQTPPRSDTGC